ncbi:MAG: molybdopterin-guanine dinucleotide biosynthesis protein B [Epsilonproteobacteria bacterium]|nr:molybdopterin-guanine dinucleotide biosynthesis protein B [Campylobacterota bacterium]
MGRAVAFTGASNSGKTTLIEKIVKELTPNYKVVVIKHDPKDKATFDTKGKDSYKFFHSGADVVVASPTRTTYFSHESKGLEEIVKMVGEFDFLLVEGLKTWKLPRIAIFREKVDPFYLEYADAIAIDNTVPLNQIKGIEVLDLNNTHEIIEWIFKNAKEV